MRLLTIAPIKHLTVDVYTTYTKMILPGEIKISYAG